MTDIWWILVPILVAVALTALSGRLQRRTRISPEQEKRELAKTERRIAEIEREQR